MASDALAAVKQLKDGTSGLRTLANGVSRADVTKEFSDLLEDVIATLSSVNTDLCVGSSAFVQDYDMIITGPVAKFVAISNQIGGEIAEEVAIMHEAFLAQRAFISVAAECKQPSECVLVEILKPTSEKVSEVQSFREQRRPSKFFNHLSAVSEGTPVLGWVTVSPKPAPFVKEMIGSATFYTNRVLKEFREKDPIHVEWTKSLIKIIQELEEYVKKHHLTGVSWNKQGKDAAAAPGPPAAPAGGAPGPPPPPPPPVEAPSGPAAPASKDDAGRSALFADLNKGGDVTIGLKKVTDDMKTHKNPELKKAHKPVSSSPKPYKAPAAYAAKPVAAPAAPVKKPPRLELVEKRWDVEYFENNNDLRVQGDMKQTVYIYKCQKSTVHIPSKVNSITLDGCKKVGVVFESVLGSVDIVNCQSVQIQVTGKAAIINIDKTDGCMVYLSKDSKEAQIISAKSSEMNVLIPDDEGEFTEFPLPEQYCSVYTGKNMKTTCVDSLG